MIVDGTKSDPTLLQWGVPQGSVIGPMLFICYTAPIQDIIHAHNLFSMMYADDTQLYISVKSGDENCIIPKIETCLQEIRLWMQDNFLFLNDSKMEILHLSSHLRHVKKLSPVTVNGIKTYSSKAVRNLGVVMDNHLSMRNQVNTMCSKASFALIGELAKYAGSSADHQVRSLYMISSLQSVIIVIAFSLVYRTRTLPNYKEFRTPLHVWLVSLCKKYEHITPILKGLHWLPIKYRIVYKILLLTFKCLSGQSPQYLQYLVIPYVPARSLRSASQNLLVVKRGKTKAYGDRAFSCITQLLWNSLPYSVQSDSDINTFQTKRKTHLFQKSY